MTTNPAAGPGALNMPGEGKTPVAGVGAAGDGASVATSTGGVAGAAFTGGGKRVGGRLLWEKAVGLTVGLVVVGGVVV